MGPRFHFSSAIFGQDYLERFLAAGLPSQLSPGNLPALAGDQPRPCYHIHAPAAEALAIRASALYPRLQALVEVEFHDIQAQVERFRARACSGAMPRWLTSRSTWSSGGTSTTMTRSKPADSRTTASAGDS